jgi:hypothetical protein
MNVLKFNPRDGSDEAKKLAWYAPLAGCRIAIGNEARMDGSKMDGNMMKTLSSGGDSIFLRQNFKDQIKVEPQTTFFGFMNDMPPVSPCDQALKNRMCCIPYLKSFVDKPASECGPYELPSDPKLKEKIERPDWIDAMFWIIADAYGDSLPKPQSVVQEIDELFVVEDCRLKEIIEERYEFAPNDDEAFVPAKEINAYLKNHGLAMSETKVGRELARLGLTGKVKKIDGKTSRVWFGLRD